MIGGFFYFKKLNLETYIRISTLNDFLFCPKSLYYHELYAKYHPEVFQERAQTEGTMHHQSIDSKKYSSSSKILQGLDIYSEHYSLCGKIDLYYQDKKVLMERKSYIQKLYLGHIYQLYAQYFCMIEMGYEIDFLHIHSMKDNKTYHIDLPSAQDIEHFETLLSDYHSFHNQTKYFTQNPNKCAACIYKELCDYYLFCNN